MKTLRMFFAGIFIMSGTALFAQVQINKPIQLTGGTGERIITNLEAPVNGTDAVNKDYVDAAVAASGGSSLSMMSEESSTAMNKMDAQRHCAAMNYAGQTDWRMPTHDELFNLYAMVSDTLSGSTSSNYVWMLTHQTAGSSSVLDGIRFSDGFFAYRDFYAMPTRHVRCVR